MDKINEVPQSLAKLAHFSLTGQGAQANRYPRCLHILRALVGYIEWRHLVNHNLLIIIDSQRNFEHIICNFAVCIV